MATDQAADVDQEEEKVELTQKDLAVIDEIEGEDVEDTSSSDDTPVATDEVSDEKSTDQQADEEDTGTGEDLAARARSYGLDPDHFTSTEALQQSVDALGQNYAQFYQQQQARQQAEWSQQQAYSQQEAQLPVEFRVELDDDYDEGLRDAINGMAGQMAGHFNGQMEVLAQHILNQQQYTGRFAQQEQLAAQTAELAEFDSAVKGLGDKKLFGESVYQDTKSGSKASKNMDSLYGQAVTLARGYEVTGQAVPGMSDLIKQAYRISFSDEIDDQNRQKFNNRMRKASSRRLGSGASTKAQSNPEDPDYDPADDPVLKDAYNGFLKDNGDI